MPAVNELLYDLAVTHQIGLQRLSTKTVREVLALVNKMEKEVLLQLGADGTEVSRARLNRLLTALDEIFKAGYAELADRLGGDMVELAVYETEYQQAKIGSVVPITVDFTLPSPDQLQAAVLAEPFEGRHLKQWSEDVGRAASRRVSDAVNIGFALGETTPEIVTRVRGTKLAGYKDGLTEVSRRGAEGLVRTALNHTANFARDAAYANNKDLIKEVRWVSTLDTRTTPICRSRDGMTFPVGSGPRPPAHWGCRSTTSPVTKSWKELGIDLPDLPEGTRASMNGQVPAAETYQTWLKRQPEHVQDDVLGKARGKLFRQGGITVDRFVDSAGNELTLDELRQRDAAAFKAAGL